MKELIGYCGLNCETCEAYIATKNDDNELRKKVSKLWSELNGIEITPEMINCTGCRVDGVKTIFCDSICQIRQCALAKNVETCADCEEMEECEIEGTELLARCICHELDHLDGHMYTEKVEGQIHDVTYEEGEE